jgi:hypothetical protein
MNNDNELKKYITGLAICFLVLAALIYTGTADAIPVLG